MRHSCFFAAEIGIGNEEAMSRAPPRGKLHRVAAPCNRILRVYNWPHCPFGVLLTASTVSPINRISTSRVTLSSPYEIRPY